MSPAAPAVAIPTRSEIEAWTTAHLADAATAWRGAAAASEDAFDQHRRNINSPGGTTWEGDAKDAALDRVTRDISVVGTQNEVLIGAAGTAENAVTDINAAKRDVLAAIAAAEADDFTVGEDLSVTDTRAYDIDTAAARATAAAEHAEDIRWTAERLAQADSLAGSQLQAKATELEGIRFDGEGQGRDSEPTVRLVSNEIKLNPPDVATENGDDQPGDKPTVPEQAPGQIGPFAVPKAVEDAAKNPEPKPEDKPGASSDVGGDLGDLLGAGDTPADGKPEEPAKTDDGNPGGLPSSLGQVPPPPDKAAIDRQAAKVESARQALAAAEAKMDGAAGQGYMQGAGAGPSREDTNALSQAVFDARAELTEQQRVLNELNYASAASGGPTAPVEPLPENADVQAFPTEPPVLDRATEALTEGTKDAAKTVWDATMPDVGNMYDVVTDYDNATPEQKRQAAIDTAGMVPWPGAKILGEGIEHGLDALGAAGRHVDDTPTPHVDAPSAGHAPVEHHAPPPDAPADHHVPDHSPGDFTPDAGGHPHIEGGTTYESRLGQTPINNGHWQGERGESMWVSDNPDVNRYLEEAGVPGIEYRNGYPDFGPVTKGEVEIPNMTTSRDANFRASDNALAQEWGVTRKEVEIWRKENGYTWHEQPDLKTMQLVPSVVNNRLGHVGGIGELNAGAIKPPIGDGP